MARYREGEIPKEQLAVLVLTAILGVLIGIALTILGRKGKIMWMWVWGIGLVACSLYLGAAILFDVKLFGFV